MRTVLSSRLLLLVSLIAIFAQMLSVAVPMAQGQAVGTPMSVEVTSTPVGTATIPTATTSPTLTSPTSTLAPSATVATATPTLVPTTVTASPAATASPTVPGTPAAVLPTSTETGVPTAMATATPLLSPTPIVLPTQTATVVLAGATPAAAPTADAGGGQASVPRAELPLVDQSGDAGKSYLYRAAVSGGYTLDLFGKGPNAASVRMQYARTGASLAFTLPGTVDSRTVSGAVATARVGSITVTWTSYADRLKEDLVLAARPAGDQVVFALAQQGLAFASDGRGGSFARDRDGSLRFHVLAPTLVDALGRAGKATLALDPERGTATIRLDPAFLAGAAYPLTVDPTVTYADEVSADSPLSYWRLNEASGSTAYDSGSAGMDGTINGGVTLGQTGALDGDSDTAMAFDGSNDYIALPSGFADFTSGVTLEAWIYPTSVASGSRIVILSNGSGSDAVGLIRSGTTNDLLFQGVTASGVLVLNTWQHVAGTQDASGNVTIYYNGQPVATGTASLPSNVTRTVNYIGSDSSANYFAGRIDEVAVYGSALSGARIAAHFQAGAPPTSISIDGSAVSVTTSTYSTSDATFTGTAGQFVSLGITGVSITPSYGAGISVSVYNPDGSTLGYTSMSSATNSDMDFSSLAVSGTYTIRARLNPGTSSASMTFDLTQPVATSLSLASPGSQAVGLRPGQNVRIPFTAAGGEFVGLGFANQDLGPANYSNAVGLTFYQSDGVTPLDPPGTRWATTDGGDSDVGPLTAGNYFGVLNAGYRSGTITVGLTQPVTTNLSLTTPGSQSVTLVPGQDVRIPFTAAGGEYVSLGFRNQDLGPVNYSTAVGLTFYQSDGVTALNPPGTRSSGTDGGDSDIGPVVAGNYFGVINPGWRSGTITVGLSQPLATSLSLSVPGTQAVTLVPGQDVRIPFTAAGGEFASLGFANQDLGPANLSNGVGLTFYQSDGVTSIDPPGTQSVSTDGGDLDVGPLSAGNYFGVVNPGFRSGTITVGLTQPVTGTLSTMGGSETALLTIGQDARYSFGGSTSQQVTFTMSSSDLSPATWGYAVTLSIIAPNGSVVASNNVPTAGGTVDATLPSVGTYTARVSPGYRQGHVTLSFGVPNATPPPGTDSNSSPVTAASGGVNTYTGAYSYTYAHTDLAIPGRGPSPAFVRSYNSNDTRDSPLGVGWTHNYNIRLTRESNGDVTVVVPEGRSDTYPAKQGGGWNPPPGIPTSLVSSGTYTVTLMDQTTWSFTSTGMLTAITDRYGNQSSLTYNSNGQLTAVSDPAGRGSLTFAYNSNGRLTSVTDWQTPTARVVQFGYDASQRLTSTTDRESQVTSYAYDGTSSRLTTLTDARYHTTITNSYDSWGRVDSQQDATGQQTTFDYGPVDEQGDRTVDGQGHVATTVTYPAASFDGKQAVVVDTYSGEGATRGELVQHQVTPSNVPGETYSESYTYDDHGFPWVVTDARGNTTTTCYDKAYDGTAISGSRGNVTRVIAPAPAGGSNPLVTLLQYDSKNNLLQSVLPKGVANGSSVACTTDLSAAVNTQYATDYTYDAGQTKLLKVTARFTDPDLGSQTAITKYEYTEAVNPGLVTKVIPARGNDDPDNPDYSYATTYAYYTSGSQKGLLQSVTDPLSNVTTYTYDAVGRKLSMVDPNGNATGGVAADHTWEYTYDKEDRTLLVKAPAPTSGGQQLVTEARYDAVGNRTVAIDANGQVTKYVYDVRNQLQEVQESPNAWTDPSATPSPLYRTVNSYDHRGNLSRLVRASGDSSYERALDYAYDGLNRLRKETQYPSWPTTTPTLVTQYTYDANSNRLTLVDPLSQTTTFGYDAVNRLSSITYSGTTTANVSYEYDANSNRTSMGDGTGSTSYQYDQLNRLTTVTSPVASGTTTVGYRYDLDGNRTKVIYPDGTAVTYSFNKGSQLGSLSDGSRTTSYEYFPDGGLNKTTHPNTTTAEYIYDNALRLTQVWNKAGTNTISRHTYTLDPLGNRTQVDEVLPRLGTPGPIAGAPAGGSSYAAAPEPLQALSLSFQALQPTPDATLPTPTPTATNSATPSPTAILAATATPTATPTAALLTPVPTPTSAAEDLVALPLLDQAADANQPALYAAQPRGYTLDLFSKGSAAADVKLVHSDSGTQLNFSLTGPASSRTAQGATASAVVGDVTATWTSYADRLKEDLVLATRPSGDQVSFSLTLQGLTLQPDGRGGYWASDAEGLPHFQLLAPTLQDAQGRVGGASLAVSATSLTLSLDSAFLATAVYPLLVDPTVIYTDAAGASTAYNNSRRLVRDPFGKLLLVSVSNGVTGTLTASWSNDGGQSWSRQNLGSATYDAPTWELDPSGDLHLVYVKSGSGIAYRRLLVARDANQNITGLSGTQTGEVLLRSTSVGQRPSLVIDRNGRPAVAWSEQGTNWQLGFLRATGDPEVAGNWKNGQGSSTNPDVLSVVPGTTVSASASLARMPGGTPSHANDEALYVFVVDNVTNQLSWRKAQVSSTDPTTYQAWTTTSVKGAAMGGPMRLSTAADATRRGIVVSYQAPSTSGNQIIRKQGTNDADSNDVVLLAASSELGRSVSLAVDRGDLYAFYRTPAGLLAYRGYRQGVWDGSDNVVDSGAGNDAPAALADFSNGWLDVAWTRLSDGQYQVLHDRTSLTRLATTLYGYDHLSRLTSAGVPSGTTTYTYDPLGNRLSRTRDGIPASYAYDRADRITSGVPGVTYTVNANGNLTGRGSDSFVYDQTNRLISATVGGTTTVYAYDGDGKRVSTTVGGVTTRYVYDVSGSLPMLLDDGTRKYIWGQGLAFTVDGSGNVRVPHTDGLGSVRALSESTPSVVQTYQTDEFGVPSETMGTLGQPLQYTGEQRDGETGLVYLRARMYDPQIGRFLQRDTVAKSGRGITGWNRFAYSENNPVNRIDASGRTSSEVDQSRDQYENWCFQRLQGTDSGYLVNATCLAMEFQGAEETTAFEAATPVLLQPRVGGIALATPPSSERGPTGTRPSWRKGTRDSLADKFGTICPYCMAKKALDELQIEHVEPWEQIKRGAETRLQEILRYHDPNNLVLSCRECNLEKGARTLLEFLLGRGG